MNKLLRTGIPGLIGGQMEPSRVNLGKSGPKMDPSPQRIPSQKCASFSAYSLQVVNHLEDIRSLWSGFRTIRIYPRILDLNKIHAVHRFSFDKSRKNCTKTSKTCQKTRHLALSFGVRGKSGPLFQGSASQKSITFGRKR